MDLSNSILKQFANVINPQKTSIAEATVYGTVVKSGEEFYARIDGSDGLTPVSNTVEIKDGDRVVIMLKNHTATVTGNISDPSASGIKVTDLGIEIENKYVKISSLENGTTTIDGGCIKTGKIDAEFLNLTGAITFSTLDDEIKTMIENAAPRYQYSINGTSNWHTVMNSTDYYRRESYDGGATWGTAYQFRGKDGEDGSDGNDGSDADVPSYIKSTYIDSVRIKSPTIEANEFNIYPEYEDDPNGSFNIYGDKSGSQYHMFTIDYMCGGTAEAPRVNIYSPAGAEMYFGMDSADYIMFRGTIDFRNATVLMP